MKKISENFLLKCFLLLLVSLSYTTIDAQIDGLSIDVSASFNTYEVETSDQKSTISKYKTNRSNYSAQLFLMRRIEEVELEIGVGGRYRDYGYSFDDSHIVYWSIPSTVQLTFGPEGFFVYGLIGMEWARVIPGRYFYPDPDQPSNTRYNYFIHTNDMLTFNWGLGIGVTLSDRVRVLGNFVSNRQVDNYDGQYGKTMGAFSFGVSLRYQLFEFNSKKYNHGTNSKKYRN